MAEHLEIELKWELDAHGHAALGRALTQALGEPRVLEQDNRFFDSADLRLRRAALNLRLRRENDRLLMTCKGRGGIGADGEHRHTEWEEWLDPATWAAVTSGRVHTGDLPLPDPVRSALGDAVLVPLGGFANHRLEFHYRTDPAALLCLDRTNFLGLRTDYELEIETAAANEHASLWRRQLNDWGIGFRPQPLTKFARFISLAGHRTTPA
jgi:uncharacterized protein YjbK